MPLVTDHNYLSTGQRKFATSNGFTHDIEVVTLAKFADDVQYFNYGGLPSKPAQMHETYWPSTLEELENLVGSLSLPSEGEPIPGLLPTKINTLWGIFPEEMVTVPSPGKSALNIAPNGWSLTEITTIPEGYKLWTVEGIPNQITEEIEWGIPSLSSSGWLKPGTTLIDGNSIYTGDAYVDTLQIKGNAVTLTEYFEMISEVTISEQNQVIWTVPYPGQSGASYTMKVLVMVNIRAGTLIGTPGYEPYFQWNFGLTFDLPGAPSPTWIAATGIGSGDYITLTGVAVIPDSTIDHEIKLIADSMPGGGSGNAIASMIIMGVKR